MCERELETEQNCNLLTPHSIGHNHVSFPFSWAANPRAWWPSLSGTCSSIQHLLSNCNCSIGGQRAHSAGCYLSLPHLVSKSSDLQLTDFLSSPGLYNNLTSTLLPASVTISHSFNPSTIKVIITWYSSTGCTCYLHRYISYFDSLAGSEVNMQHYLPLCFLFSLLVIVSMHRRYL